MTAEWITKRLGAVARTQYGLSEPMNEDGKGFKIFRMGEVQDGRLLDTGRMKFVDISTTEFEQYRLRPGDVLFNRTNSFELVGKTGIFALAGDYCFASYLVRLNLDREAVLPEFLNYLMNSGAFQRSIRRKASRSINQANINATILSNEVIRFPRSLPEQRRIVAILDEAFEGLATARTNAEQNLESAREVFESRRRSVFTKRDQAWSDTTLDRIAENLDSKRVPITKSVRTSGEYPYYGASGIVDYVADYIFEGDALLVSEDGANLLMRSSPIAFPVSGKYWVNNHAHILRFSSATTQRFVEMYLESIRLDEYTTGAAQPKLTQKALNSIPIPLPKSVEVQNTIVAELDSLLAETQRLESIYQQKLAALDELKKSLLREAFNGNL